MRELHWHPNASEWQYVLSGAFRVTLFGSHGRWREETLAQGDVGYIPQGFGHSIENIGDGKARILIVFNTGHYQTIDLSQWIAGNSRRRSGDQFFAGCVPLRAVPARGRVHHPVVAGGSCSRSQSSIETERSKWRRLAVAPTPARLTASRQRSGSA